MRKIKFEQLSIKNRFQKWFLKILPVTARTIVTRDDILGDSGEGTSYLDYIPCDYSFSANFYSEFMCRLINASVTSRRLVYHVHCFLNACAIFPESSSLLRANSYFVISALRYLPFPRDILLSQYAKHELLLWGRNTEATTIRQMPRSEKILLIHMSLEKERELDR